VPTPKPTVGRIVLFALLVKNYKGEDEIATRPAIITHVWSRNDDQMPLVQLAVFRDGSNDGNGDFSPLPAIPDAIDPGLAEFLKRLSERVRDVERLVVWKTSISYDQSGRANTWRWMDYQLGQAAKTETVSGDLAAEVAALKKIVLGIGRPGHCDEPAVESAAETPVAEATTGDSSPA
jgi:hypothetical protein